MKKLRRIASRLLLASACIAAFNLPAAAQDEPPTPEDVAGIWKAGEGVLYTLPEDQDNVLATLGAQPAGADTWTAQTQALDGTRYDVSFRIQSATLDQLQFILLNPSGDPIPCPHPNYVVYKNSVCGPTFGVSWICQSNSTGSQQRHDYPGRACRRRVGAGYCVDVRSVVGRIDFFDVANCSGPVINSHNLFGWRCNQ